MSYKWPGIPNGDYSFDHGRAVWNKIINYLRRLSEKLDSDIVDATADRRGMMTAADKATLDAIPETYETQEHAAATYETQDHAAATYETQDHAADTYETKAHAASTYETQSHAAATYETKGNAITGLSASGTTVTYTKGDGTTGTFETQDHDTIYTHPEYTALTGKPTTNQTPGFGDTVTVSQVKSDGTGHVTAMDDKTITIPEAEASQNAHGLMSAADKKKLDGITAGAEPNQDAYSNIKVGSTTIAANGKTATIELVAGTNVTLTLDATNDKITIAAKDTVYTHPTTSGNKHVPAGGSNGQILRWSADGTAVWGADNNTTYSIGTASGSGNAVTALTISGNTITPVMGETFSKSDHTHAYLPLSGGTITGAIKADTFSGSWIGALKDGNAIISKIDDSNYSAWLNGYTKNYKVGLSSYPGSDDKVYLYSQTKTNVDAGTPNSRYKSLIWNADTGQLETDIVQTDIVQVGRIKVNTSFNSIPSINLFTSASTNNNYREFTTYITNDSSVLSPQSVANGRIGNVRMWNLSDRRRVEIYAQNATNGSSFSSAITLDAFNNGNTTCVYNGPLMKIGTSSVGSASVPVYLNQGTITACTQQDIYTRAINTSGFICFNNGIQMCWGRRGVTQQGDNVITFPRAFKTAPFVVVSRYSNPNTTLVIEQPWIKGDPTTTQFNAYLSQTGTGIYYIALGLGAD